jgi:hypothetical protein
MKPLFQQKSRDPHQASLCACNKAEAVYLKPLAIVKVKAARHCQSRSPLSKPPAAVKAARRC